MGASATDIITYIGVPLAVIGVSPVFYFAAKASILFWSASKELKKNNVSDISLHASIFSGKIKVQLQPHLCIEPPGRGDPEYWKLAQRPSQLKGGSWTTFNWKVSPEPGLSRTSYLLEDLPGLWQSRGKIAFSELVKFLLERGAVLNGDGIKALREAGLRTPPGTVLLQISGSAEVVLSTVGHHSDDPIDTLIMRVHSVNFPNDRNMTSPAFGQLILRPYNGGLAEIEVPAVAEGYYAGVPNLFAEQSPSLAEPAHRHAMNDVVSENSQNSHSDDCAPFIISLNTFGIGQILVDKGDGRLEGIHKFQHAQNRWFLSALKSAEVFRDCFCPYVLPQDITSFARRIGLQNIGVPCGVLTFLEIRGQEHEPRFVPRNRVQEAQRVVSRARGRSWGEGRQPTYEEQNDWFGIISEARQIQQQDEIPAALRSAHIPLRTMRNDCLAWLKGRGSIDQQATVDVTVETILYRMLKHEAVCNSIVRILERWLSWNERGAMSVLDYLGIQRATMAFCEASILLDSISSYVTVETQNDMEILDDCMRRWGNVLLG